MALPAFMETGDLPVGIFAATLEEVTARFGAGGGRRSYVTRDLVHIHALAQRTRHLQRFILFGSYITAKPHPNDVDIVLVMTDAFRLDACSPEARGLFDHAVAQARHGASIFWVRPGLTLGEAVDDFVAHWQVKRDGTLRGIVEVIPSSDLQDAEAERDDRKR